MKSRRPKNVKPYFRVSVEYCVANSEKAQVTVRTLQSWKVPECLIDGKKLVWAIGALFDLPRALGVGKRLQEAQEIARQRQANIDSEELERVVRIGLRLARPPRPKAATSDRTRRLSDLPVTDTGRPDPQRGRRPKGEDALE